MVPHLDCLRLYINSRYVYDKAKETKGKVFFLPCTKKILRFYVQYSKVSYMCSLCLAVKFIIKMYI